MGTDPLDPDVADLISMKANTLAKARGFSVSDVHDIEQEQRLVLIVKREKLVPRNASQKTVIDNAMDNCIRNIRKHRFAKKRDARRNRELDGTAELIAQRDGGLDSVPLRIDVDEAMKTLPLALQPLARELMLSTPTEAARELKLTRGQMRQQMKLIARHFQACGFLFAEQEPKREQKLSIRDEAFS